MLTVNRFSLIITLLVLSWWNAWIVHPAAAFAPSSSSSSYSGARLFGILSKNGGAAVAASRPPSSSSCVSSAVATKLRATVGTSSEVLDASKVFGRYYNLQEMEDKESSTTEIFLFQNGTIALGDTDGPRPEEALGTWSFDASIGNVTMSIVRTFRAGSEPTEETNMGEFSYTLERHFVGEVSLVGKATSVTGAMHHVDPKYGDQLVGFFNLIDTTKERKDDAMGDGVFGGGGTGPGGQKSSMVGI